MESVVYEGIHLCLLILSGPIMINNESAMLSRIIPSLSLNLILNVMYVGLFLGSRAYIHKIYFVCTNSFINITQKQEVFTLQHN